jgi:hypothetical protein
LTTLLNLRGKEEETAADYQRNVIDAADALKQQFLGVCSIDTFIEHTEKYKEEKAKVVPDKSTLDQMKEDAFEEFVSYLLIRNADQEKYGSIKQKLKTDYSMGQNMYPTSTTGALDILSRHKPDNANKKRNNHNKNGNPKKDGEQDQERGRSNKPCSERSNLLRMWQEWS